MVKMGRVTVTPIQGAFANRLRPILRSVAVGCPASAARHFQTLRPLLSVKNIFADSWSKLKESLVGVVSKPEGRLVGTDDQGNQYFEAEPDRDSEVPHRANKPMRYFLLPGQRSVEDAWMRLNTDLPRLPNEWDAWLRHSRRDPPSSEEIAYNRAAAASRVYKAQEIERKRLLKLAESGANNKEDATKAESNGNVPFPRHPGLEVNPGEGR